MAWKLAIPALLLALSAAIPAAQAEDFQFYKTVKHSDDIFFQGRTVDDVRKLHAVDPKGTKLGEIDGVLVGDTQKLADENKVAALILDLKGKIAKHKKVLIAVADVKFDPTNRKQIIINKTIDELRSMRSWGSD